MWGRGRGCSRLRREAERGPSLWLPTALTAPSVTRGLGCPISENGVDGMYGESCHRGCCPPVTAMIIPVIPAIVIAAVLCRAAVAT